MRHVLWIRSLAAAVSILVAGSALAEKAATGSASEAKAMEEKALGALKMNEKTALVDFAKADGPYRDRDLYVFCFNTNTGLFLVNVNQALIGTDNRLLKEKDGSPLGQKVFDAANSVKEGEITTVAYNWPKPGTTEPSVPKETYVGRVGTTGCGVGYYK